MSDRKDFVIEDGVLLKYTGPGGDVVPPNSVTSIGEKRFFGCVDLTIHAPVGSCAEEYAKEYSIPFVAE